MRRRIGYRNSKRMELFLLASMLDTVLRSRGNVVDEPPARYNDEAHKDIMDSLRKADVHDVSVSRSILMDGLGNGDGSTSVSFSVSLPEKKSSKKQFMSKNKK